MTKITIVSDGEQQREYEFQTINEEHAEVVKELILRQIDNIISVLNMVGAINAEDPPEFEE